MYFKFISLCILLFKFISCDKSLTLVIDTTKSMQEELDVIKVNLATAIYGDSNSIGEYIILPFNDPDVGDPIVSLTPRDLIASVNRIFVHGGHECPENSLGGIERALQVSKPNSNIFLFTDAYPKDVSKLESIENLCRNTHSQVVIFVTGYCLPSESSSTGNVQMYYDVAKACSGTVFRLDMPDLRQAFKYMKEVIKVDWTEVITYEVITEYKQFSFSVDSFTTSVLLAVSGEYPSVVISPPLNSSCTLENILESRSTQVISIIDASPGQYSVAIRCRGVTSAILYKKRQLPLRIGFSTERPRSIKETSQRPLPGRENYLLIEASITIALEKIAIHVYNELEKKYLDLDGISSADLYLTKTFIEPDKSFRIWISGYNKLTFENVTGSTESIIPQQTVIDTRWTKPKAEILDGTSLTVNFGNDATVACKVSAYPKPRVWWEADNGVQLPLATDPVLLEIPSLYISYVHIENVTTNFTLSCKCMNSEGEDSQNVNIYAYRPYVFEVLQIPQDQAIEYGNEGKLYCQVSAYPEAEIKWYHNGTLLSWSEDTEIVPEENALFIKHMNLNDVGEYKCEVTNEFNMETFIASVSISGLEAPQVAVERSELSLKIGDWTDLECSTIKGKPTPTISWSFKPTSDTKFGPLPEKVEVDGEKLRILAQIEHNGVFKCLATNVEGQHFADVTVIVQYPPTISNNETRTMLVKEGDDVELPCDVTASPPAVVHWEVSQDDVIIPFDDRHVTDSQHTHRFKALWKDSGNYHCIAENDLGKSRTTITINVLVKPYIEPPRLQTMVVRAGDNITLPCNVIFGNPVPSTKWKFIALDSTTKILKRSHSSGFLRVVNIRHANEGTYMCIAENDVSTDSIKINVKVK